MWNLTIGKNIECALEAVLFSLGEAVEIDRLAEALEVREDEVRNAFTTLQQKYEKENRGIKLIEIENSIQMCSNPDYFESIKRVTVVFSYNMVTFFSLLFQPISAPLASEIALTGTSVLSFSITGGTSQNIFLLSQIRVISDAAFTLITANDNINIKLNKRVNKRLHFIICKTTFL